MAESTNCIVQKEKERLIDNIKPRSNLSNNDKNESESEK